MAELESIMLYVPMEQFYDTLKKEYFNLRRFMDMKSMKYSIVSTIGVVLIPTIMD